MRELSLHILDIVQNSIAAGADRIEITICEEISQNILWFAIKDNGCGMDEKTLANVTDPFFTTRTTRRVGLGIPLLKSLAQACGGDVTIESALGQGVYFKTIFQYEHIDRPPLGDMSTTMLSLILGAEEIDFIYHHTYQGKAFQFSTGEMREILGDLSFHNSEVLEWLKNYLIEGEGLLYSKETV
jgi:anti-sigma regulatory factor (Ser/Thr protein kinase)